VQVTDDIGAVARTVLESLRTLFVWLGDLAIFYIIPLPKSLGEIGEKWDNSSYLQAVGFAILVAGTLVYARGDQEEEKKQASDPLPFARKQATRMPHCPSYVFRHPCSGALAWTLSVYNILKRLIVVTGAQGGGVSCLIEREGEIYFKSHISLWEHSSHFRLIGRGVPSVSVVSQLMYKFLCLASPKENP